MCSTDNGGSGVVDEELLDQLGDTFGVGATLEADRDDAAIDMHVFDAATLEQALGEYIGGVEIVYGLLGAAVGLVTSAAEGAVRFIPNRARKGL